MHASPPLPLLAQLHRLNDMERERLSPAATPSAAGIRRRPEEQAAYRQNFALDADRILHSRAYSRYIDKTQVFSLISNDHITHRVLHVQLVSRIARTIGRFLALNEDLIEAISLGHDIGHPPFGHDGERILSELCTAHGLPPFQHNLQSVRFLDTLERRGRGWNLTLQVLDGILCHDGESASTHLKPSRLVSWGEYDRRLAEKQGSAVSPLVPSTAEGCVVRLADTIAYIGRDIEDAIHLGLISRDALPDNCRITLGASNGTIVYNLVTDLIAHSTTAVADEAQIGFSPAMAESLLELKAFNYQNIYLAPETKTKLPLIEACYRRLFAHYLSQISSRSDNSKGGIDAIIGEVVDEEHHNPAARVRDFLAGMTDDFFLRQAEHIGCVIPQKQVLPRQPRAK
jgi:dGTPase